MSNNPKTQAEYNKELQTIGQQLRTALKNRAVSLQDTAGGKENKLRNNFKVKFRRVFGDINRISYSYPRHGYFYFKGVGRGYKSANNAVVRVAKSPVTKPRTPKDWMKPLDVYEKKVADVAMEYYGNKAMNVNVLKQKKYGR